MDYTLIGYFGGVTVAYIGHEISRRQIKRRENLSSNFKNSFKNGSDTNTFGEGLEKEVSE